MKAPFSPATTCLCNRIECTLCGSPPLQFPSQLATLYLPNALPRTVIGEVSKSQDMYNELLAFAVVVTVLALRVVVVIKSRRRMCTGSPPNVVVVLGSGGHTGEMMLLLEAIDRKKWLECRPTYIVSATDKDSANVADRFEFAKSQRTARVLRIPRAREVGQSYFTSVFTTLRALFTSVALAWQIAPDVILCNGPGVCVPVVFASFLVSVFTFRSRPLVAYFESFTCVQHLSLSGSILFPVADFFSVQWPELKAQLSTRNSKVVCTGPFPSGLGSTPQPEPPLPKPNVEGGGTAVVTVGSTCFDELMREVDSHAFFLALRGMNIKKVLVQKGRSNYSFRTSQQQLEGVELEVVEYRPQLAALFVDASLVVSHAGAGTILEVLAKQRRLVVVPNARLMSNHQLQLARALHDRQYLYCLSVEELGTALPSLDWGSRRTFPPADKLRLNQAFEEIIAQV